MKTCLKCNEHFNGRSDKKFCSDGCRNVYNNDRKEKSSEVSTISSILKRNRQILAQMLGKETKKTSKEKLLQQGFNFYYFTNIDNTKGNNCYFCFEYGYLPTRDDHVRLVKR
jgi:hypothetical protein